MFFKRPTKEVERERNQRLLEAVYSTKASWDHARETERAVYEATLIVNFIIVPEFKSRNFYTYIKLLVNLKFTGN